MNINNRNDEILNAIIYNVDRGMGIVKAGDNCIDAKHKIFALFVIAKITNKAVTDINLNVGDHKINNFDYQIDNNNVVSFVLTETQANFFSIFGLN